MADIITNTKTVLVRLSSPAEDNRSVTLDFPRENITLAQIKQAFTPLLNMRLLLGNKGDALTAVESATVTTSQKIKLGDSEIEIIVSPNVFQLPASISLEKTFTITGSKVLGAYFANVDLGNVSFEMYTIKPNDTNNTIDVDARLSETPTVVNSGTFNIVTELRTISLPIQLAS